MISRGTAAAVGAVTSLLVATAADGYEFGSTGWVQQPGLVLGAAAAIPSAGLYGFDQVLTYQSKLVGPGAPTETGASIAVKTNAAAQGLLWVPGWSFLGATYDIVAVLPFASTNVGPPINFNAAGMSNMFFANELSWKLGDSGFFVKAGLGIYMPTGTQQGPAGLGNVGNPWWTFQPNLVFSYLKDGWNLTANFFDEINTANAITGYRSGDVLHAEFTAVKTIGNWTVGPVAYYVGQITSDRSSAFYGGAVNVDRYNIWAVGGMVGYNFGPASVSLWGTQELTATASGGATGPSGLSNAVITKGFTIFAQLNYQIWAPESPPAPQLSRIRK